MDYLRQLTDTRGVQNGIAMKVTLREKTILNGRKSLYLDFYPAIINPKSGEATRREFLGLYIYDKPRTELERQHNKETKLLGQNICAQRQLAIQKGLYGFLDKNAGSADFLGFFKKEAEKEKAKRSIGSRNNWMSVYMHLHEFTNGQLLVKDLTEELCKNFKNYLTTANALNARRQNVKISINSAGGYFTIFKTCIKRAIDSKLLDHNPAQNIKRITGKETKREFLTLEELKLLAKAECDLPYLKQAALFSALTGLRYSDIAKLTWGEVYTDNDGYKVRYTQQKTQNPEDLPISDDAYLLLGTPGAATEKVFPDLLYSAWQNQKLQQWAMAAGITKLFTFHSFRHTYATLQITLGTDIYTVSKMLGHRDIKTTQIYAKIVDEKKREAANKIKL